MHTIRWARPLLLALGVAAGLALAGEARAQDRKDKKDEPKGPVIIQLDASKLPPEVIKALMALAEKEPKDKKDDKKPEPRKEEAPRGPMGGFGRGGFGGPGGPGRGGFGRGGFGPRGEGARGGKPITLTEAIALAEKDGKGEVVKAERKGEGANVVFTMELLAKDGKTREKIELDSRGKKVEAGADRGRGPRGFGPGGFGRGGRGGPGGPPGGRGFPGRPGGDKDAKPEKKKDKNDQ
jgi:translation initiation factor IF-2